MTGRTAISFFKIKNHAKNGDMKQDWVIAGVLVSQSPPRISQKGSKYLIWTLSDLKDGLKTVTVFLFGKSFDELWKTSVGTVLGILNPKPLDQKKNSKDEAALSIINPDQVMIWGKSKDYGICKGIKKNGEKCNSFVNKYQCEFCAFHVQKEYRKYTGRGELQSTSGGRDKIRNRVLGKNEVFYGGKSFTALPKVGNSKKLQTKDVKTLGKLGVQEQEPIQPSETTLPLTRSTNLLKMINNPKLNMEENDKKRLNLLNSNSTEKKKAKPALTNPETDFELDLSKPIRQAHLKTHFVSLVNGDKKENQITVAQPKRVSNAKKKALAFVQKNGQIAKENPTGVKKEELVARGLKRPLEDEEDDGKSKLSERFLELMKQDSKHVELIEAHDLKEQEAYFEKMGKKEQLEEKMMSMYKIECKAVKCLKCKYTWFSASDKCKSEGHPIKIIDAIKRFFKCNKCSNRTVSLEILPIISCKKCGASSWIRTTMMKDKIVSKNHELSIRGGEQTFMNSCIGNANIDLMMPE